MRRIKFLVRGLFCFSILALATVHAATNSFKQTNLVSDTSGMAPVTDPGLVNPWGVAFFPGNPFWVADNNSGLSTLYSKTGMIQPAPFTIPPPAGSSNPSTPTGIVANAGGDFNVNGQSSLFIFDTEDGTISGWYGVGSSAFLAVDNSAIGAVYKGLALISNSSGNFLLATNFNSGNIDIFDSTFHSTTLPGTFHDPNLPSGYAPFGIHLVNNQLVVTYALQDAAKHDPVHQAGAGFVDLFDLNGNLVRRIASHGNLNAPWGAAIAPAGFGSFAGDLLIGNFGDGTISVFDFTADTFIDQLKDNTGAVITNASLWELLFDPSGRTGDPNTLYITAGLANEKHGLFAALSANTTPPPPAPDFTISTMPASLTISAGQPATFTITAGGVNGFSSAVTLSCSGQPAGTSCKFMPPTLSPASGATATSTLTIATSSNPYGRGAMVHAGNLLFSIPLFSLVGLLCARTESATANKRNRKQRHFAGTVGLLLMFSGLLAVAGCGGYNSGGGTGGTPRGTSTVVITGTSGSTMHSSSVTLTVN
ncbi:MAG TPA: TIGR03118 family protein [Candidatus Dormibacteraeota bacterium]|nr:TIGR03118 family protein [Candidatus Dormibacteraeota bacterium]